MKLPNKVNILGREWKIERRDRLPNGDFGWCDPNNHTIIISHEAEVLPVLWHEIVHAIEFMTGIEQTEEITHLLAVGLHDFSRDNPNMLKYLTS